MLTTRTGGWRPRHSLGLLAALCLAPVAGHAGLSTGATGPTYNAGPESAWMNPAGMTSLKTSSFAVGAAGIIPVYEFEISTAGAGGGDGGSNGVATFLPSVYMAGAIGDRFRLGLSIFSPLGGPDGLGWDFDDDWAGRYGSQGLTFASMAFGPSAAFKINDKWSIGVGGTAQWLKINYEVAVDRPLGLSDAKLELDDLEDWTGRFFAGTRIAFTKATSLGVVYRSQWDVDLEGERVESGFAANFPVSPITLGLKLPQQVEVGLQQFLSKSTFVDITFGGDAKVDRTTQGFQFQGEQTDNVAFVLGGSLQMRW